MQMVAKRLTDQTGTLHVAPSDDSVNVRNRALDKASLRSDLPRSHCDGTLGIEALDMQSSDHKLTGKAITLDV